MQKVLIANRGEIAVRVIRACRDAGYTSVAVYADPDRDALHVRMADEAFALGGDDAGRLVPASSRRSSRRAQKSGADAVHPGYGFLSENADFAQAVIDAGLTWIGPSPKSIARPRRQGRWPGTSPRRAGAPLVAGTKDPVKDADEVVAFAEEHGLPIAIKAAFGGGGRGMKIAREMDEVADLYDSAVREAKSRVRPRRVLRRALPRPVAARRGAGAGRPARQRHRRRHPRLLAAAPQPEARRGGARAVPHRRAARDASTTSAKAICREAKYHGAGTVEYLVGADGVISFLEVNTRLQVEHPVTEETSGIDLVREQFRIAEGETLRFDVDPSPRGHAFEFRINGEDPGRNFLPAPGTVTNYVEPAGPGVRVDSGIDGDVGDRRRVRLAAGQADRHRRDARRGARARPPRAGRVRRRRHGHRAAVPPRRRARRGVHADRSRSSRSWIETEFDNRIEPFGAAPRTTTPRPARARRSSSRSAASGSRCRCRPASAVAAVRRRRARPRPKRSAGKKAGAAASGDSLTAPMQGTIVKVAVADGDTVEAGQTDRRPRGDEDGAAAQRAQGRHGQQAARPRSVRS